MLATFKPIVISLLVLIVLGALLFGHIINLNAQSSNFDTVFDTQFVFPKVNLSNYDLNTVNITMLRGLCLGSCPAYYLEIHGDGKVIYRGHYYVKVTGERTSHIDPEKVRELVKRFNDSDYFNFRDRYDQTRTTDLASVETSISIDEYFKSVYHYLGTFGVPEVQKLKELESLIDNITNSAQWVKGQP